MIRFSVLSSGSGGNATYVEVDGYGFLLDCGINKKIMTQRLKTINRSISDVKHIHISHDHTDHIQGIGPHMVVGTFKHFDSDKVKVTNFNLSHDFDCVGFIVSDNDGNKLAYITDTGYVPERSIAQLFDCNAILLEFNYDMRSLVNSAYSDELQKRIYSAVGHLSNECASDLLKDISHPGLEYVVCLHLSKNSNNPELVRYEAESGVYEAPSCKVVVAEQDNATPMFTLI